jgi:HlyD family secretion protein
MAKLNGMRPSLGVAALAVLGAGSYAFLWPMPTPSVTVGLERASQTIVGPGVFDARRQVGVTARLSGFLETLAVDRNDTVTKGQLIATLDDREIALAARAAEARLRAATATRDRATIEGQRARTLLKQARSDFTRQEKLLRQKTIAQAVYDQAKNALDVATITALQSDAVLAEAEASLEAARADLKAAQVRLDDTQIHAPLAGVVTTRDMTPGDLVSPGMPLMRIVDPTSIVILARFDESTISLIHPGQTAQIGFGTAGGAAVSGKVALVGREVDPETREYVVDIRLDRLPEHWAIGRRVTVQISAADPGQALMVPQSLLARRDGKTGLWLAKDGRARWVAVTLGYLSVDRVEMLSGVSKGDVVLDPAGLFPWRSVEPVGRASKDTTGP